MPTQPQTYINGKPDNGLAYDWNLIKKTYKSLNCPSEYYDPTTAPLASAKYFCELSDRSTGKTTNWILLGLCAYWLYGCQTIYVRQFSDHIAPKYTQNLWSVIIQNGYIEKLTGGVYNHITYKSRRWYLCKNNKGDITDIDDTPCMFMCSVDKAMDLKSSANFPLGDIILYDEFIGKFYTPNEFVHFCDLVKTIIRERHSPIVVMLANTIDKHSQYFNELEVYDEVQVMHQGDHQLITTDRGTKIYVEMIGASQAKKKKRSFVNKLFFGFNSPEMAAITGDDDWAVSNYQHIPEPLEDSLDDRPDYEYLIRNVYIFHNQKYARLDIVKHKVLGIICYVHWATRVYDDSIILTCQDRQDPRYYYRFGPPRVARLIDKLNKTNGFYFASNDVGSFVTNYVKYAQKISPLMPG